MLRNALTVDPQPEMPVPSCPIHGQGRQRLWIMRSCTDALEAVRLDRIDDTQLMESRGL